MILLGLSACTGAQLQQSGEAVGTAGEVVGAVGAATGNPLFLGGAIALGAVSAGLTALGAFMKKRGK